jgi:DNA-binding NtrC family response regulator
MQKYILLIDDDKDEMDIISEALDEIDKPMSCIQSTSASAAMNVLNYLTPGYIFLDLNMPDINGLKCLEEIRKIKNLVSVPVILYSNFINEDTFKKAIEAGAAACIKKPRKIDALAEILKGIFSTKSEFKSVLSDKEKNN